MGSVRPAQEAQHLDSCVLNMRLQHWLQINEGTEAHGHAERCIGYAHARSDTRPVEWKNGRVGGGVDSCGQLEDSTTDEKEKQSLLQKRV